MKVGNQFIRLDSLTSDVSKELSVFLSKIPGFHFFQSPQFFAICQASKRLKPYYILAKNGKDIVGCLLYFKQIQVSFPLVSFFSSRTIIWGGPVVEDNSPEIVEGILEFYKKNCPATIYTQVRNLTDSTEYRGQFLNSGFHYVQHLNILIDMSLPEDDLWKNVHTKRRNQIRRAEKEGCTVEQQNSKEALAASYLILKEVYRRAKLPLPDLGYFELLRQQANLTSGLRLFTVSFDGEIIGCMLCLAYDKWLFDYYAGASSRHYKKYPNDLLPWAVFKWGKKNNFTQFDFGGAGKPDIPYGVRDYKKQFGGEMVSFGRYEYVPYSRLFRAASYIFRTLQKIKF